MHYVNIALGKIIIKPGRSLSIIFKVILVREGPYNKISLIHTLERNALFKNSSGAKWV